MVGKRTKEEAKTLINQVKKKSNGKAPLFISDGTDIYKDALLSSYNKKEVKYAKVIKEKKKGRVIKIRREVILGDKKEIDEILKNSIFSKSINTSFVERNTLSIRQSVSRFVRKALSFSKSECELRDHVILYDGYFNFVKPHEALKVKIKNRWMKRTPAMAAGKTSHVFSLSELLSYKIVQGYFDTS